MQGIGNENVINSGKMNDSVMGVESETCEYR